MKKISQFNQYLLERFPSIWNTKILWVLLLTCIVHILFFIIGYFAHSSPRSLQNYLAVDDYFSSGVIIVHIIFSVIILVMWLTMMFKNNAFKNFYPLSRGQLFGQFIQYFIIIFASTSFYFSYKAGDVIGTTQRYPDKEMTKNIDVINRTMAFLPTNIFDYTLSNRLYPTAFYDLYLETNQSKINFDKKYYEAFGRYYQYSTSYKKTSIKIDRDGNLIIPEPERSNNTKILDTYNDKGGYTVVFQKEVVDVSDKIITSKPSFYNYSNIFYNYANKYDRYNESPIENSNDEVLKKEKAKINKVTTELLNRKDRKAFENLFSDFFAISKKYKIETNLNVATLTEMSYKPNNYEVNQYITTFYVKPGQDYDPPYQDAATEIDVYDIDQTKNARPSSEEAFDNINTKQLDAFFKKNLTNKYYSSDELKKLLTNIHDIKSEPFFVNYIHVFLWIAFFLSTIVFSFRVAGLRTLLFSIVSTGVIILVISFFGLIINFGGFGDSKFIILYLFFITGLIILLLSMRKTMTSRMKFVTSICMVISINFFVPWVLLFLSIINQHQVNSCYGEKSNALCEGILDILGASYTSLLLFIIGLGFLLFYSNVIRNWKALPE